MLLIGSRAALFNGLPIERKPKDYDVIGTYDEVNSFVGKQSNVQSFLPIQAGKKMIAKINNEMWEFEIAWEGTSAADLLEYCGKSYHDTKVVKFKNFIDIFVVPSNNILYTLKLSHRYLKNSPHFLKTMRDIQLFRKYGCEVPNNLTEWLKKRQKKTYSYSHPKLNVKKDDFFKGDGITYVYDHDSIHEAMKHMERPAYTYFKKDGEDVACDKAKFFNATPEARLYSVLEETYVLALERSQIPFKKNENLPTPLRSFKMALMKVCTSITSGWWREFAWEHYDEVLNLYDPEYVNRFWKAVHNGTVIKLQENA